MAKAFVIVLAVAATIESANGIRNEHMAANVTQTLDYLLATNRYDKRLRPGFGGSPVTISVNFLIKSMGPVSDNDQSFGLDCYFRQHWYDLRLKYQKFPGLDEFPMSWLFLERVWKPDTYFINGKRSFLHRITVPNKFLRIRHDGFITYSIRLTITASCPMYLRKFPLDAQRCPLKLGSYGYTNEDLIYKWTDDSPIGLQQGVEIAQFDLVNITTEGEKTFVKGGRSYSTVQANFWLKRHTGYFLLQVYIPCGLIVLCSWISFWIDPDAVYVPCGLIVLSSWVSFWIDPDDVAARVALGVTTVLSLTTMGFGGRSQLPKVSYWTALDWFVIICFTSVFSVMIEYAIVNFVDKFKKDLRKLLQGRKEEEEQKKKEAEAAAAEAKQRRRSPRKTRSASFSIPSTQSEGLIETIVQVEQKPSKKLPRKLSAMVDNVSATQFRSKSIPDLSFGKTEEHWSSDAEEDSMDSEAEPAEVVLEVLEEAGGAREGPGGRREGLWRNLFGRCKLGPRGFWSRMKIPGHTELINLVEGSDPADKFSRIDVQSRRNFPIAFFLSLVVYLFAFSYYLTDDIPIRDSDGAFYK